MKSRFLKSDLLWSFASLGAQYGSGLVLMFFAVHQLNKHDLGVWYTFSLIVSVISLFDFGYQATFVRNISYILGGARSIVSSGLDHPNKFDQPKHVDYSLLATVIRSSIIHYRKLGLFCAIAVYVGGVVYMYFVLGESTMSFRFIVAWTVFSLSSCISIFFTCYNIILFGFSRVSDAQRISSISRIVGVVISVVLLVCGFGVLGGVLGYPVTSILSVIFCRWALSKDERYTLARSAEIVNIKSVHKALAHNAHKAGSVGVAVFFVLKITSFFANIFLPLEEFSRYSVTFQIFQALQSVSRVRFNSRFPYMSKLVATRSMREFETDYYKSALMGWGIYIFGGLCVFALNHYSMFVFGKRMPLLSDFGIFLMFVLYFFEIVHGNAAIALTCFNEVPFVAATWITAAVVVVLSGLSLKFTAFGVYGLLAAQIVSNGVYNSWRWPLELRRKINVYSSSK